MSDICDHRIDWHHHSCKPANKWTKDTKDDLTFFSFYFYKTSAHTPLWALTHQLFSDVASSLTKSEQNEYYTWQQTKWVNIKPVH